MQEQKSHHTVVLATEYARVKHTDTVFGVSEQRLGEAFTLAKPWL